MKIFISWSGERSKRVAELLKGWLKCVIQACEPWVSTEDISRGAIWFSAINDQLANVTSGIVCLTAENKEKPWILFEAGAMAKGITSNKVYTFLIDLKPSMIQNPLAQFNHTMPVKEEIKKLINSINIDLGERSLDKETIDSVFDTYWSQFKTKFDIIIKETEQTVVKIDLTDKEILLQLLEESKKMRMDLVGGYHSIQQNLEHTQMKILEQNYKQQFFNEDNFWRKFKDAIIKSFNENDYPTTDAKTNNIILDLHQKGYSVEEIFDALKTEGLTRTEIKKIIESGDEVK